MEKHTLKATKRKIEGRKVKSLRRQGILPGNLYGKKVKSQALQLDQKEFTQVFEKVGETGLVELHLDEEKRPVLIHNVQYHQISGYPIHVDFYQVDLKERVTAKVPVEITGESPAVKDKLGVLLHILSEIEVEALPVDLPEKIEVDISGLKAVDDTVKISSLKISGKIKILVDKNLDIVKIAPLVSKEAEKLAKEEAEKAAAAAAAAAPEAASGSQAEAPTVPTETPAEKPTATPEKP